MAMESGLCFCDSVASAQMRGYMPPNDAESTIRALRGGVNENAERSMVGLGVSFVITTNLVSPFASVTSNCFTFPLASSQTLARVKGAFAVLGVNSTTSVFNPPTVAVPPLFIE
jgi:hypothetical protein